VASTIRRSYSVHDLYALLTRATVIGDLRAGVRVEAAISVLCGAVRGQAKWRMRLMIGDLSWQVEA
jgi:hypothetical protein